jgi:hypothetical protein
MGADMMGIYSGWSFNSALILVPLKLFIAVILCGVIFYSFLLVLKLRVLKDTIDIEEAALVKLLAIGNLAVSGAVCAIVFVLILL